jgi:hypothetical protein
MLAEEVKVYNMWDSPLLSDPKKVLTDVFLSENTPVCTLGTVTLVRPSCFVNLQKWFLGQLPPKASRENIAWFFVEHLKITILWVEKIKQWSKGGKPTGCFHVYCNPQDEDVMIEQAQKWYCSPDLQVFSAKPVHVPAGWSKCFVTVEKAASIARHRLQGATSSTDVTPALSFEEELDSNQSAGTAHLDVAAAAPAADASKPFKGHNTSKTCKTPSRNQQHQAPPPFQMSMPMYMPHTHTQYGFGANFHEGGMINMYAQPETPGGSMYAQQSPGVQWVMMPVQMMQVPMMFPPVGVPPASKQ